MDFSKIKRELEKERCPSCGNIAEVVLSGDNLTFKVCCPVFENHLRKRTSDLVQKQVRGDIDNLFTGL